MGQAGRKMVGKSLIIISDGIKEKLLMLNMKGRSLDSVWKQQRGGEKMRGDGMVRQRW